MNNKVKILVAAAWPYANGSLHLGHVASLLGADIIARYYRLRGNDVLFVSGSDCHGTPIAVEADRQGVHPSEIANKYHQEIIETLIDGLNFSYDIYTKTTTDNHRDVVQDIFLKLDKEGFIYTKIQEQAYCEKCKRFLPDRYIEGECPVCHFEHARGDQCDNCGNLLDSKQLINPRCKICSKIPAWKETEHFFLKLSAFEETLKQWVDKSKNWRGNAKNFTMQLLRQGLHDRAITRDIEWGVPIPLPGYEDKRIYVWFEAVCGYLSASIEWSKQQKNKDLWRYFWEGKSVIAYYVHGKDNIPFHTIIWPSILLGYSRLHLPDRIISSEYLTLEKQQFSTSRNWAVWLPDFLAAFDPETLRYYLSVNGPESADADFSWSEFQIKINKELIGDFGNFIHRTLSFIQKNFPNGVKLKNELTKEQRTFLKKAKDAFASVGLCIENGRFRDGLRTVFSLAVGGNKFFNDAEPWVKIKKDLSATEQDLAVAAHVIRCLAILTSPYLPKTAERLNKIFKDNQNDVTWKYPEFRSPVKIDQIQPLYKRIEDVEIKEQRARLDL